MENNPFQTRVPSIAGNPRLRTPQREAYTRLQESAANDTEERELGVILPVGCGKSGLITLAPFAFRARRTLVVAPGVKIAEQLADDFDPSQEEMFYKKCQILSGQPYPEPVTIRGTTANRGDLDDSDVVVANIQQLQGDENRWLRSLPPDFFNLILFDEGHHNVATSWDVLRRAFPDARIVNFSATPLRADGQRMAGRVIYSYPVFRGIQEGYIKRLKALVLNPRTLRYVRREDGQEVEVGLDEVRRLGEQDAGFRRSIVTSQETLTTIVDASLRELERIRAETGDRRHKIIASALNYEHCAQVVEAYRARGRAADYVHSREDSAANERVLDRLANHEIDVIVQVRKLGEGFNHPYLSVAAVFSVFGELSPFVQFVGRIMRVIVQNAPTSVQNQGTVVFHAGANVARRWADFQEYSEADQEFFDQLLPLDGLDFGSGSEIEVTPTSQDEQAIVEVSGQGPVLLEEIPLLARDEDARRAFELLRARGFTSSDYQQAMELEAVPTTRQRQRQAARAALDQRVANEVGRILRQRGVNPEGRDLDTTGRRRTNFVVLKSAIDRRINAAVGRRSGERSEFTRGELGQITERLPAIVAESCAEVFDAQT